MKPKQKRTLIILVSILLISLIILVALLSTKSKYSSRLADTKKENTELSKRITDKQNMVNTNAEKEVEKSTDSTARLSADQTLAVKRAKDNAKQLFAILLTYDSSKTYKQRKSDAEPFFTKNADTSGLFTDDKGTIDAMELNSKFDSVDTTVGVIDSKGLVQVISIVKYESWYTGSDHGVSKDIYIGTFDYRNEQFTKLTRINNLTTDKKR